jgi:hypothetical protein
MKDKQMITVRLPIELYEWLRQRAFDKRTSQADIVTTALDHEREREQPGVTGEGVPA